MSSSRLLVSSFLIGLGVVLLLGRLGTMTMPWDSIGRYWPVLLVLLGVGILDRRRKLGVVPVVLLGVGMGVTAGALVDRAFSGGWMGDAPESEQERLSLPLHESTRSGIFRLEAGAGTFVIRGTTDSLVSVTVQSRFGHYVLRSERIEQSEEVRIIQEGKRRRWLFSRSGNRVSAQLNPAVPWDVHVGVGASRLDLDLTPYVVERVTVECGVSQIQLRLGDRAMNTRCSISAGASSIRILLPHSSACEIDADTPLSRNAFDGFTAVGGGRYRTENFFSASRQIFLTLEAGVSNIRVVRY
jgi:hypothetical protein